MAILGKLLILLLIATGIYISFTVDRDKNIKRCNQDDDWFF